MNKAIYFVCLLIGVSTSFIAQSNEAQPKPDPKVLPVTTARPDKNTVYPIAIIGAGAGGTMAVKRSVLHNRQTILFTGAKKEIKNSRGNWVRKVENTPGLEKYTRTIVELRDETLINITKGPFSDKLFIVPESVMQIRKEGDIFHLTDSAGDTYCVQYVVLATGMMDTQPIIQGSIKPILKYANKQHINYCILCDGHRALGKKTVVIGYQEDAAKGAILLWDRYKPEVVSIVTNGHEPEFTPETMSALQERNIQVFQEPIQSILGNEELKEFQGFQLESASVEAEIGFVLLGIRPNNSLAISLGAEVDERGLVITDKDGQTSVENLFVVGDLRSGSLKQIYTAWQQAVEVVQVIDRKIRGH